MVVAGKPRDLERFGDPSNHAIALIVLVAKAILLFALLRFNLPIDHLETIAWLDGVAPPDKPNIEIDGPTSILDRQPNNSIDINACTYPRRTRAWPQLQFRRSSAGIGDQGIQPCPVPAGCCERLTLHG